MEVLLQQFVDIMASVINQQKDSQDVSLKVIQITFSIIDQLLVPYFNITVITRMYAICF